MNAPASFARSTGEKVRRDSLDVDDPRAQVFRPIEGGIVLVEELLRAFDDWASQIKRKGQQHELSANCGLVLRVLLRKCTNFKTGICEPCLDTLTKMTRLARPTVVRCLALLKRHKFIDWIRRTERIADALPGEQQVRQVSNAYWFDLGSMPKRVATYLAARMRKRGMPIEVPREPRRPIFSGRYKRQRDTHRRGQYDAIQAAQTPAEQAAARFPNSLEDQQFFLDSLGQGASSQTGLNPGGAL